MRGMPKSVGKLSVAKSRGSRHLWGIVVASFRGKLPMHGRNKGFRLLHQLARIGQLHRVAAVVGDQPNFFGALELAPHLFRD